MTTCRFERVEVDDAFSGAILNVGVANIPFLWNGPVKDCESRGHLTDLKVELRADEPQRFTNAIAGDAPADGIEFVGSCRRARDRSRICPGESSSAV